MLFTSASHTLPYSVGGNHAIPHSRKDGTSSIGYIYVERSVAMTIPRDGSIQGWKFYTDSEADINMMVLRPVPGSETEYTIVGENFLHTPKVATEILTVPEFDRIDVKNGDVVAWLYLPGSDPTIQYVKLLILILFIQKKRMQQNFPEHNRLQKYITILIQLRIDYCGLRLIL